MTTRFITSSGSGFQQKTFISHHLTTIGSWEGGTSPTEDGHLHQALADGAAVAEAESLEPSSEARSRSLSSRRPPGPPTEPRRSWILGMEDKLDKQ